MSAPDNDSFDRLLTVREELAGTRNMLGQAIHGLSLAAKTLEQQGQDASLYRELVEEAKAVRWAA